MTNLEKLEEKNLTAQEFVNACSASLYCATGLPLQKESGCSFIESGAVAPLLNVVMSCSLSNDQVNNAVEKIVNYFEDRQLPHSWWTEIQSEPSQLKQALEEKGLTLLGEFPGMLLKMDRIAPPSASEELSISNVTDNEELAEWSSVISVAFGFSESVAKRYTSLFAEAGLKKPFFHLVGKKKGNVVCTGTLLLTEKGGYIYNISTDETERKHGYASEISCALIQLAKSHGCSQVALISSPQAVSLYTKLGFEEMARCHIYASGSPISTS